MIFNCVKNNNLYIGEIYAKHSKKNGDTTWCINISTIIRHTNQHTNQQSKERSKEQSKERSMNKHFISHSPAFGTILSPV